MSQQPVFEEEFVEKIADDLVYRSLCVEKGERVFLSYDPDAMPVVHRVADKILEMGAFIDYDMKDARLENLKQAKAQIPFLTEVDALLLARIQRADCYLLISCPPDFHRLKLDARRSRLLSMTSKAMREQIVDEERTRRCGLYLPTRAQAQTDQMTFEDYKDVYFQACNQDWEAIFEAHESVIAKLDEGRELRFEADFNNPDPKKVTNLKMSIEGMTFANSTIHKNYPGSEVFSAPILDSVEGTYFSPGRFFWKGGLIRDIHLRFEDGFVVDYECSEGREHLEDLLNTDQGSRRVGEIGIGTNPGLLADVSDGLLFEKKGASFHIALGSPYHFEVYMGKRVHVDNGGESTVHWDVTNMLNRPGGSRVILDGEVIQKDGRWLLEGMQPCNPSGNA